MENSIEFKVYGPLALFTEPFSRLGGEKISYQIPTYGALIGMCKSIYWKPTFLWVVDKVRIMNQINMETRGVRIPLAKGNDLANYTYLTNVEYRVKAHIEWNTNRPEFTQDRNWGKHLTMAVKALKKGGRLPVKLGTTECLAYVEPCDFNEGNGAYDNVDMAFGLMYHGRTYPDEAYNEETKNRITINMWNATMKNGVIEFPRPEDCPVHYKTDKEFEPKEFEQKEA